MSKYDFKKIEKKWQKHWLKEKAHQANETSKKQKYYQLETFPYPSAAGLHVGHPKGYIAEDIHARYKRMKGFEVLYTIGWDAFGLPTENYAIKVKKSPKKVAAENIENFKRQVQMFGLSYDWDREINTSSPEYYKWTQWLFIELFKKGLAYRAKAKVNWCPKDQTVLANEQVIQGRCERDGELVEQKEMDQWFLKITDYTERLLGGLKGLDWPAATVKRQEDWIGKSEGALIKFPLRGVPNQADDKHVVEVFTTRPDTLFGATFVVVSPELAEKWITVGWDVPKEVRAYVKNALNKRDREREGETKKTGIFSGIKAVNPGNKKEIPVWIADYVLGSYGTGAIMGVPAHDERDFEFAEQHQLPRVGVVIPTITDNTNPPREGKTTKVRRTVHAVVYNPARKAYLTLRWKKFPWNTVVLGGVDDGEDEVTAALREVKEETGFVDLEFKRVLGDPVEARYYANHKDENRIAVTSGVYFEMRSEKRVSVAQEEADAFEVVWKSKKDFVPAKMTNSELPFWIERLAYPSRGIYVGSGVLINSGKFDGMDSEKAKWEITKFVGGERTVRYKLRDWSVSRQRYWGVPIPMVHCAKCGIVPVPEKDLPVLLPDDVDYRPKGKPPLASSKKFMQVSCPQCGGEAERDPETLDTFVDSSWYFLRYTDPHNKTQFAAPKKLAHWMPVDLYVIGAEHTVLHLLYSRFITKFLFDASYLKFEEPFLKLRHVGLILGHDGQKMSKSKGNVVNPDELIEEFGADAVRLYEMFMGPFDEGQPWDPKGVIGMERFLKRVWKLSQNVKISAKGGSASGGKNQAGDAKLKSVSLERLLHKTIKKVTEDIENLRYNTAISALMVFLNEAERAAQSPTTHYQLLSLLLKLLAPFAPHMTEEIWRNILGHKTSIHKEPWPEYDPALIKEETFTLVIQVNGKVRDMMEVPADISEVDAKTRALQSEKARNFIGSAEPKKVIYVPKRLVNIVTG